MSQTLLILVNDLGYFISHRLEVALASKREGYKVKVAYGDLGKAQVTCLREHGIDSIHIPIKRGGVNPLKELETFFSVLRAFQRLKPDMVHLVTVKPYLYGGIAARLAGVSAVVSAVAGLGSLFIRKGRRSLMFRALLYPIYWFAFGHPNQRVIVQNQNDANALIHWHVLDSQKVRLLRGSGVNLAEFTQLDEPESILTVCFAARLLRDKGVYDFVCAVRLLLQRGVKARFLVAGETDLENPTGLTEEELRALREDGIVEILGYQSNIPTLYAQSHIICLPSYREGLPKSLIEAAAASRAIVTTDVPGCRDAIIPNTSGLLVPVKNPEKLADALQWLIEHPRERVAMGKAGRQLAEREFAIEKIVQGHLDVYRELLDNMS
jgi:glycosyltransferase involved in cell wall biosynthesis